jgi:hypothetical protein
MRDTPPRPGRYFHAWMLARVYELLAEVEQLGEIPDGPISAYGHDPDGRFVCTFTITLSHPPVSAERAALGAEVLAAPLPPESPINTLSTLERAVLSVCGREPQAVKVIARKVARNISRVREAVASLVGKGLLERTARWGVRLASQQAR